MAILKGIITKNPGEVGDFPQERRDKLVGIIEAMDFDQKVNMVTIGYFLAEAYWGKGTLRQAALWSGKGIVDLEIYGTLKEEQRS